MSEDALSVLTKVAGETSLRYFHAVQQYLIYFSGVFDTVFYGVVGMPFN